jgi:hypothetical protein
LLSGLAETKRCGFPEKKVREMVISLSGVPIM